MQRDLSAGSGDIAGNGVAYDIAVHRFNQVATHFQGYTEMLELRVAVAAVKEIIGAHICFMDGFAKLPHLDPGVVDAFEQHCLVEHGEGTFGQLPEGAKGDRGDLLGGVDLGYHPYRFLIVTGLEDIEQLIVHTHRCGYRNTGAEPFGLYMIDRIEFAQQPLEMGIRQQKSITAGDQHVAHLGIVPDIVKRLVIGLF